MDRTLLDRIAAQESSGDYYLMAVQPVLYPTGGNETCDYSLTLQRVSPDKLWSEGGYVLRGVKNGTSPHCVFVKVPGFASADSNHNGMGLPVFEIGLFVAEGRTEAFSDSWGYFGEEKHPQALLEFENYGAAFVLRKVAEPENVMLSIAEAEQVACRFEAYWRLLHGDYALEEAAQHAWHEMQATEILLGDFEKRFGKQLVVHDDLIYDAQHNAYSLTYDSPNNSFTLILENRMFQWNGTYLGSIEDKYRLVFYQVSTEIGFLGEVCVGFKIARKNCRPTTLAKDLEMLTWAQHELAKRIDRE